MTGISGRSDWAIWRMRGFARIGVDIQPPGDVVGTLNARAAEELGLRAGIPVGASAIDAHAGGIGVIGARLDEGGDADML